MKTAVKPGQDLPVGSLGPVAFAIPGVLGIHLKILQKRVGLEASMLSIQTSVKNL